MTRWWRDGRHCDASVKYGGAGRSRNVRATSKRQTSQVKWCRRTSVGALELVEHEVECPAGAELAGEQVVAPEKFAGA